MPPTPKSRPDAFKHRVLLAPDSFKGTFSAHQVAEALAAGARQAGAVPDLCPLADGGEGTLAVLHDHLGGQLVTAPYATRSAGHAQQPEPPARPLRQLLSTLLKIAFASTTPRKREAGEQYGSRLGLAAILVTC